MKSGQTLRARRIPSGRVLAIALFVIVVALPSVVSGVPAVSEQIGPHNYEPSQSFIGLGPRIISQPTGVKSEPESLKIQFSYRTYMRKDSFLIATSSEITAGVQISTDNWGNLYLTLGSSQRDEYQLMKISGPISLNKWSEVFIFINLNQDLIRVLVDGKKVDIQDHRPGHYISIHDAEMENTEISIGGLDGNDFLGGIRDFSLTYQRLPSGINLINLKLFATLILVVFLFGLRKKSLRVRP